MCIYLRRCHDDNIIYIIYNKYYYYYIKSYRYQGITMTLSWGVCIGDYHDLRYKLRIGPDRVVFLSCSVRVARPRPGDHVTVTVTVLEADGQLVRGALSRYRLHRLSRSSCHAR